jgi:VanZ family protein
MGAAGFVRRVLGWVWLWRAGMVCVTLLVVYLSLIPLSEEIRPTGGLDKWLHLAAYLAIGGLTALGWPAVPSTALAVTVSLAVGVEAAQMLTPWREASLGDLAANLAGAALGLALGWTTIAVVRRL